MTLFFSESPTNPYLRCVDVRRIAELCHAKGALVCIDSTFATPVNQRALSLGADIVIHSATKYLAGHNDVMAGALAGNNDLVRPSGGRNALFNCPTGTHACGILCQLVGNFAECACIGYLSAVTDAKGAFCF